MNNIKFVSGNEYTLADMFSGKNKIIIPDLQRDYCWGNNVFNDIGEKSVELVSGFLDNLLSVFQEKKDDKLTLGLIYGYENPRFHIQLCDGQQRITTLFLLLGMLNRKTNGKFENYLISEFESKQDVKEPYLQYAIRESTLYFLSDLTCEFFLNSKVSIEDIEKQDWYFSEYSLDASILSMLTAIRTINIKLNEKENFDFETFGKFIIYNLQMIYYDMGNRTRGEETFVIINTTGEPLTATENLKPILIGTIKNDDERIEASNQWEERETWFWENRNEGETTSDNALNNFFVWFWQIRLLQEKSWKNKKQNSLNPKELFLKKPTVDEGDEENPDVSKWEESVKPTTIQKYFSALVKLIELCKNEENERVLRTINDGDISLIWFRKLKDDDNVLNILLPLISYLVKFDNPQLFNGFLRRIRKNYFDKKWEDRKPNFVDWRYIIQIIGFSASEEEVLHYSTISNNEKFKLISNVVLNEWYNEEEKQKTILKVKYADKINEWEDQANFMGDLSFLFSFKSNAEFNELSKYYSNYIFTVDLITNKYGEKEYETENDKIKITNLIRLFLLFVGCNRVGHMSRVTREAEGVLFSDLNRNHLHNEEYKQLIASENIQKYLEDYIKDKVREEDLFNLSEKSFSTDKAIKAWLTLKVFNANKENVVLSFYDGNDTGVAVYTKPRQNNLIVSEPFSIENFMCGFGVKAGGGGSYIHYTGEENWFRANIIDTPFAGVNKERRDVGQLVKNREAIDEIMKDILMKE